MASFVATLRFTEQGLQGVRETTRRAAAFKAAAKKLGVKVTEILWCLGPYDGLLMFDAPDAETAASAMLFLSTQGNVQTETVQVFTATQMEKILKNSGGG